MNTVNDILMNKENNDIKLNKNHLDSVKNKPISTLQNISSNSISETININIKTMKASLTKFDDNTFEVKNDWIISKKDSEKTIVNNDEYHIVKNKQESDSFLFNDNNDQFCNSEFIIKEESFKDELTTTKSEQFNLSDTLINEKTIRTISTKRSEQNTYSKTFINEESYEKPEDDDSLDSIVFSPVVNEIIEDNILLPYEIESYEENHNNIIDINNTNSNDNKRFNYNDNKSLQLVESQDNSNLTISDDSESCDNIFNYNSDIILSDDEEIKKPKVNDLYNEDIIIKNLDDNIFSFINEDSYNEYIDNSIDNSENSDYSLLETEFVSINDQEKINILSSSKSVETNDLVLKNNQINNFKVIDKAVEEFKILSLDYLKLNNINKYNSINFQCNNNFVNIDDDTIYNIEGNNNNEIQCINEITKPKKKVTFNDRIRIKRIDKVEVQEKTTIKSYIKNELKFGLKKLKNLFSGNKESNNDNKSVPVDHQEELPVITIEYVDDYFDSYNRKEIIYFNEDCPSIIIDFVDDFSDITSDDEEYEELISNKYIIKSKQNIPNKENINNKEDSQQMIIKPILINNNQKNNQKNNEYEKENNPINISKPGTQIAKKDKSVPYNLHETVSPKKKNKKTLTKTFIEKLLNMERNYYSQVRKDPYEIKLYDNVQKVKLNKIIQNSMSHSDKVYIERSMLNSNSNSNYIESQGSFNESSNLNKTYNNIESSSVSKQKSKLKKKSESVSYIKSTYEILKHSFSLNNNSSHKKKLKNIKKK
ncbi:hypothetical protein H8356DRAFT_1731120 [Neocallimastix lanati (nom. inval.)]|uniref:Uncharacterized protein n=1 Tax=Neocallimastix californiae TaxID=1754190 RepID=A0A1Y2AU79_9FUNG|nr:hypothetical protein H8356DRAFT_1731120 [Neocallimastix sp. JGI-2020a]ORY26111.1 hypothetical protein LY90DRAFT_706174 [Neocallimastix californiae]|eukprot:ORY26111.1 hypothetical protein LY90DRAFT_706174 [Neocallimastix californiae]